MDILSVLAVAGIILLWWFAAQRRGQKAREDELIATSEGIDQLVAEIKELQQQVIVAVNRDDYPEAINISEQMLILADNHFGHDPETILPLLIALSNFHQTAGQPRQAIPYLQRSILLCEKFPALHTQQAGALGKLADLHLQLDAPREAMPLVRREIELRRRQGVPDAALLRAQCKLLSLNLEEPAMAEPIRREITVTAKKLDQELVADIASEANLDMQDALDEGRLEAAWQAAENTLLLTSVAHGPDHDFTYVCRGNLAEMLRRNRRFEDAEAQFQQLIAEEEKRGNGSKALRVALNNLALLYDECGRTDDAARVRERQMALLQGGGQASKGSHFNALNNLAVSQSNHGDDDGAAKTYAEALALSPEGDGIDPGKWADTLNNYGATLVNLKRLIEAGRLYKKVLDRKKSGLEIPSLAIASSFNGLGIVSEQLGKLAQAQDMFERSLAIKAKHLSAEDPSLETARHNLGSLYWQNGEIARAAEMAQAVLTSREKRLGKDHPDTQSARNNLELVNGAIPSSAQPTREMVDGLMEQVTNGQLFRYMTYNFGRTRDESISMVLVPEQQASIFQLKLSRALPRGWLCFIGSTRWLGEETHDGMAELVVIQAESQFDCLRAARTDAVNHDMETEDIIRTMQDYDRRFGIRIYSAETDSVSFILLRLPSDLDAFAQELLDFCMDLEDIELIKEMITTSGNRVELWWD